MNSSWVSFSNLIPRRARHHGSDGPVRALENLEDRLLLYSTLGANWVYGSRITYSFVPDGTSVGGTPSVLFQTLNARFPTTTWQQQFQRAAAVWQAVANINLAQVPDDGTAIGANGNQQDDPRFGDIRFSAIPQSSGTLAVCFLPPPINGGSDAGDIVFNSSQNWQINSAYDIQTVAIHEIGHALGMGHSQITYACMYANYNGQKQSPHERRHRGNPDDLRGAAVRPVQLQRPEQRKLYPGREYHLVHRRQRTDRHPQPRHHHREPVRVVLRDGALHHHGYDGREGAIEQPELAQPQSQRLHDVAGPARLGQYHRLRRHGDRLGEWRPGLARVTTSGRPATPAARQPGDSGSRSISGPSLSLPSLPRTPSSSSSPIREGGASNRPWRSSALGNLIALGRDTHAGKSHSRSRSPRSRARSSHSRSPRFASTRGTLRTAGIPLGNLAPSPSPGRMGRAGRVDRDGPWTDTRTRSGRHTGPG